MNVECTRCTGIRTAALLRGGGAVPVFRCALEEPARVWTHLMPGQKLICFQTSDRDMVELCPPQQHATASDGH